MEERVKNKLPAYIGWLMTEDRSETIGLFCWENEKPELEEIETIVRISDQNEYTTREITAREYTELMNEKNKMIMIVKKGEKTIDFILP